MKKTKKKRDLFDGKRDPATQLYRAVKRYVEANHGSIIVIGGIQMQEWSGDGKFKYTIGVRCVGRKPKGHEIGKEELCVRQASALEPSSSQASVTDSIDVPKC